MKGVLGFLCVALVIYIFWVTLEYFNRKDKQKSIEQNENNKNEKQE